MTDTQTLFQELSSTYRVYLTSFIHTTIIYFTIIGVAFFYGLTKLVFVKNTIPQVFWLITTCGFVQVVNLAYYFALRHA